MAAGRTIVGALIVHAHGRVSPADHVYAHQKVTRVCRFAHAPVLSVRVDLETHANPSREQRASAKAELNINGEIVRAHADAQTTRAAIDLLEARLRRQIERNGDRQSAQHRRPTQSGSVEHGFGPKVP